MKHLCAELGMFPKKQRNAITLRLSCSHPQRPIQNPYTTSTKRLPGSPAHLAFVDLWSLERERLLVVRLALHEVLLREDRVCEKLVRGEVELEREALQEITTRSATLEMVRTIHKIQLATSTSAFETFESNSVRFSETPFFLCGCEIMLLEWTIKHRTYHMPPKK